VRERFLGAELRLASFALKTSFLQSSLQPSCAFLPFYVRLITQTLITFNVAMRLELIIVLKTRDDNSRNELSVDNF
jgi:hypothetical protein